MLELTCKRPSPSQSSLTGTITLTLTDQWTAVMGFFPADQTDSLRERSDDVDVRKKLVCYTKNTTLNIQEDDRLYELTNSVPNGTIYKVVDVQRWKTATAITIERIDE